MKMNLKKTLSLVLAILMVMTAVPLSGLATETCEHDYSVLVYVAQEESHYFKCSECGSRNFATMTPCSGGAAAKCGEKKKCAVCNGEYGPAEEHNFQDIVDDKYYVAGTGDCQHPKKYYKSCANENCDAVDTNTFDGANGTHIPNDGVSNNNATCTADGTLTISCTVCGDILNNNAPDAGSALNHLFTEKLQDDAHLVDAGDCKTKKTYYYDCARCDFNAKDLAEGKEDYIYTGDDYGEHELRDMPILAYRKSAATCSKPAVYYKWCAECEETADDIYGEDTTETFTYGEPHDKPTVPYKPNYAGGVIKASEARINTNVKEIDFRIKAASCNERAQYSYLCKECEEPMLTADSVGGDIDLHYYEAGEPVNPNHLNVKTADGKTTLIKLVKEGMAPTCTEKGYDATYECLVEGCRYYGKNVRGEEIDALGHNFDAEKALPYTPVEDTCKADGQYARRYCKECKYSYFYEATNITDLKNPNYDKFAENAVDRSYGEKTLAIKKADHTFIESKDYCIVCGAEKSLENCSCIVCNGQGFMYIIGIILNFFWKLAGKNQYCGDCGAQHW